MIILLNHHNKQINYTAAFLQAPLDHDIYVEMFMMFTSPGKVWLLKRALYWLKDAFGHPLSILKTSLKILDFDNQMLIRVYSSHLQLLYFATATIAYYYIHLQKQLTL